MIKYDYFISTTEKNSLESIFSFFFCMFHHFFKSLKDFFSAYSGQKRKACNHCGGGRCIGACGNANFIRCNVQGLVSLVNENQASIIDNGQIVLTFEMNTHFGRMILKKCPPGSLCKVQAMVKNNHLEKLISVRKI